MPAPLVRDLGEVREVGGAARLQWRRQSPVLRAEQDAPEPLPLDEAGDRVAVEPGPDDRRDLRPADDHGVVLRSPIAVVDRRCDAQRRRAAVGSGGRGSSRRRPGPRPPPPAAGHPPAAARGSSTPTGPTPNRARSAVGANLRIWASRDCEKPSSSHSVGSRPARPRVLPRWLRAAAAPARPRAVRRGRPAARPGAPAPPVRSPGERPRTRRPTHHKFRQSARECFGPSR